MAKRSKYTGGTDVQTSQLQDQIFDQNLRVLSNVQKIKFVNCEFNGVTISVVFHQQSIEFEDCEVNDVAIVSQGQPNNFSKLSLENCLIGRIEQQAPANEIVMNRCEKSKAKKEGFPDLIAARSLSIKHSEFTKFYLKTVFDRVDDAASLVLSEVNVSQELLFLGSYQASLAKVTAPLISFQSFKAKSIQSIRIDGNSKTQHLNIGDHCQYLILLDSSIARISHKHMTVVQIQGCQIEAFHNDSNGSYITQASEVIINQSSNLQELKFRPQGVSKVLIQDSSVKSFEIEGAIQETSNKFQIVNSIFQSFRISNCELSSEMLISRIRIGDEGLIVENSDITKAKFQSIKWDKNYKVNTRRENYSLKEETDFLWNIREVYRQLKVISQKADNKIDASYFAANELEAQLKLLSYSVPRRTSAVKGWRNWFYRKKCFDSDFLVLWTNKKFSNFGNSLWLPLGWLLTFHFLTFQLLLFLSTPYRWFLDVNWPDTCRVIELFVLTLSPIHSFTIKLGSEEFNLVGIPDFVSRIVNSYFIFYFLRATRKYHY